jgi:hypothetical protein
VLLPRHLALEPFGEDDVDESSICYVDDLLNMAEVRDVEAVLDVGKVRHEELSKWDTVTVMILRLFRNLMLY